MKKKSDQIPEEIAANLAFLQGLNASLAHCGALRMEADGLTWTPSEEQEQEALRIGHRAAEKAREAAKQFRSNAAAVRKIRDTLGIDEATARKLLAVQAGIEAGRREILACLDVETWPALLGGWDSFSAAVNAIGIADTSLRTCPECYTKFRLRQVNQVYCSTACGRKVRSRESQRRRRTKLKEQPT